MADLFVINKADAAAPADVEIARAGLRSVNPRAPVTLAASPVCLDDPAAVSGKRVLVIEDGPTITHGGMAYGAGHVAAEMADAAAIIGARDRLGIPRLSAYRQGADCGWLWRSTAAGACGHGEYQRGRPGHFGDANRPRAGQFHLAPSGSAN
jgi:hypothetical protein